MLHHIVSYKRTLVLILCTILALEAHADSSICKICTCNSFTNINCQKRNLTSVPQPIPTYVVYLNLNSNNIATIEPDTFTGLSYLHTLYLRSNNISAIEQGTFTGLSNLKSLFLESNNIATIKPNTFTGLSNLETLILESNNLAIIIPGTFTKLSNLQILYLNSNNITTIEPGTFTGLSNLQTLDLTYNKITTIKPYAFTGLSNLQKLHLDANNIGTIEPDTFTGLSNLQKLKLYSNKITTIKPGTFTGLLNLQELYLGSNNIATFKPDTFKEISNLQTLSLGYNNIATIEPGAFKGLSNLQYLNLYKNEISWIEKGMFQGLHGLQILNLDNNAMEKYEDGAFLFLPNIVKIYLGNNNLLRCGCHLPAFVNHVKNVYNRTVNVHGTCLESSEKQIPILNYTQCQNYSLFQRNLQCQTCSGMMCNDSEVESCPGSEPVCRFALSMDGVKLKTEKSCSTYSQCVEAMRNNALTCNKWTKSRFCVGCCVGHLCNKNDFIGWTNSFVFRLIFKKFNEYTIPAENISRAMEHELLTVTGTFRVEYCGSNRNEIFAIYCTVFSEMTKSQLRRNISQVLNESQALRNLGVQQSHMEFIDEMVCDESTTSANNRTFYWPMTKVGTTAEIPCHAHVATRYCSPKMVGHPEMASSQNMSTRKCSPFTGIWQEADMSQCYNTEQITQGLKDIESEGIDEGNINNISKEVLDISQKSEYFKEEDVELAVDIHEEMVPFISKVSANITLNNTLRSINNLLNITEEVLSEAEQEHRSANRLLNIIEAIPEKIPLEEQQVTAIYSNLAIGVAKVNRDTFDGLFYSVSYGTNETEGSTMINRSPNPDQQEADVKNMASISLPRSLLKHLKDEERACISRITFFSMRDDKLYRVKQKSNTQGNTKINSYVLAANVPNVPIKKLDEPLNITFNLINQNASNLKCVYWDESPGLSPRWSPNGCKVSKYVPGKQIICSCNYLTSFAVMDVYQNEGEKENVNDLSIISNTGCGISFVFLVLTIIIHVCFRNRWDLISSKVLVCLCSSLAATNFIFLVGMQSYVQTMAACKAVAAFLHYFLLTSLMWMSAEAFHVFLSMVDVLKTYQMSFMKKSSILAWGLPAVIVIITLAVNNTDNYTKIAEVCWLSGPSFYAAILTPVVMILIFNFIMLSLVIWRLVSLQGNKRSEHKRSKVRVLGLVGLLFLLGLTWVFAFLAVHETTKVFEYLFTIFNTLQGMFIFIFYCIYKKDTRDVLKEFVNKRKRVNPWKVTAGTSSSTGNEIEDKTAGTNL